MKEVKTIEKKYLVPFFLVSLLFLLWGLANNMTDTLLAAFKKIMDMSDTETSLIQFAFYGSYFCFALPASIYIQRHSYKAGILLGLLLYACGAMLFYPAALTASYLFYLVAIYIMAGGCSVLETAANPYVMTMGDPDTAVRRLNVAQSFNPLGSISGILISQTFILRDISLYSVSGTYAGLGMVLVVILIVMLFVRMPLGGDSASTSSPLASFRRLWKNTKYRWGVIAQFFYVGAQIGVWSFTIQLSMKELGISEASAANVYLGAIVAHCLARFLFTWLMKYFQPALLMAISASVALVACVVIATSLVPPMMVVAALVLVSFCMSLMFPTIYGIALKDAGEDTKMGAAGLIMAILGGAVFTPLQAACSDLLGLNASYAVPAVCFVVVLLYARSAIEPTR